MAGRCSCPDIRDEEWDVKEHNWSGKKFYAVGLPMIYHVPVNIGSKYRQLKSEIERKGYQLTGPFHFLQKDGVFRGMVIAEIKNPGKPDPKVTTFGTTKVWSKVYYGSWRYLRDAVKELKEQTGKQFKSVYFWYVTCPECAEEKGYKTVIFAEAKG